jgi:hypothetical protein
MVACPGMACISGPTHNNYFMPDRRLKLKHKETTASQSYSNYHSFHVPARSNSANKDVYLYPHNASAAAGLASPIILKLEIDHINSFLETIPGTKQYRIDPVDHNLMLV